MKDKLKRKKYMGVCRCEFSTIRVSKPQFPNTVTTYTARNRKNRGSWSSGRSVKPTRMNSVTMEPFPGAILQGVWAQEKKRGYTENNSSLPAIPRPTSECIPRECLRLAEPGPMDSTCTITVTLSDTSFPFLESY